jgi:low temperature requirement protein LtrA
VSTAPDPPATRRRGLLVRPTADGHTVTTLELFFDLVFVFAITQVTEFMADNLGLQGSLRGLVLLALLWWAWSSYAWLGTQAHADAGIVRASMVTAMAAMFVVALAIPQAWTDDGSTPVMLAVALAAVRLLHLSVYAVAAAGDRGLRVQIIRTAVPVTTAAALLVVGAAVGGRSQTAIWALALVIDYVGVYTAGNDWRLPSAHHFTERHGLIVIIALGESIVAIGVGVAEFPLTVPVVVAALLGLTVTVALWWTYFDYVAKLAREELHRRTGVERIRLASDGYTYLHFPMVAGIIYLALGLKKVTEYVADTGHHSLSDPLAQTAQWALFGGVAAYLLAHALFEVRIGTPLRRLQIAAVATLLVAAVLMRSAPALSALVVVAAVLVSLVIIDVVRGGPATRLAARRD